MAASTLTFGGINTNIPAAYSRIDTTALERAGFGATGIVAVVGESNGGRPYGSVADPLNDVQRAADSAAAKAFFQKTANEDMRALVPHLFAPAKDDDIPSGAQELVFIKVNPAVQSTLTLQDLTPVDSVDLTSLDFGGHTSKINVQVEDSLVAGKLITVKFEEIEEIFDEVGGTAKFTLDHTATVGPDTVTATNTATTFDIDFSDDELGQDDLVTTQATGGATIEAVSSDAGDTALFIVVYGLDAAGDPQTQTVQLTGTSAATLPGTWNLETAMEVVDASGVPTNAAGTITLRNAAGAVVIFDMPNTSTSEGLVRFTNGITVDANAAANAALVADGATTQIAVLRGFDGSGLATAIKVTLNGTTPVDLGALSLINTMELADVEVARTLTLSGKMLDGDIAVLKTVRGLQERVGAITNVTIAAIPTLDFELAELDVVTALDIDTAAGSFYAVLWDVVAAFNTSQLVSAAKASGAVAAPDNTGAPVFLTGGHEGDVLNPDTPSSTNADWQAAFDLLRQLRVNTIVTTSNDASVHAIADAHCAYMGGAGRSERDHIAGSAAAETKTQIKARALALNSRHSRLASQEVDLFDEDGARQTRSPIFMAAILAGMQAGSPVGTPLTRKNMNVLGVSQDSSWNPMDDAKEMIAAGVVIGKYQPTVGFQVVRNVTTNIGSTVSAFTEASENEALNIFAFEFRSRYEIMVGRPGFVGSAAAGHAIGEKAAAELIAEGVITAWRNLTVSLVEDRLPTKIEVSVVGPINFVPVDIHAVPYTETASSV